ncbi:MAG: glycosyltransferase family 4 protein [Chloroflexi bacterium]|nr:glycosyltransferase family 4 protein [Chloroflexota bacterium]
MRARGALYVTYDGLLEPLGESQVLGYVERLARSYPMSVLSFEKPADLADRARVSRMEGRLAGSGVRWIRRRYHKRPMLPATGYDIARGVVAGLAAVGRGAIGLVHVRGYVPGAIGLSVARATGRAFVFDMRGFWPEEKVDAGHWTREGTPYRLAKRWERRFFEGADAIVSLTDAGVKRFPELGYRLRPDVLVDVIPTCADLAQFAPGPPDRALAARLGLEGRRVVGCVGTLSNWYLREPTLRYLAKLVRVLPDAVVLFVTREDHGALRADAGRAGLPASRAVFARAEFAEMPAYLRLLDVAVFFIKMCFSKTASAPTRLAELLGVGVPVVINDGIGDSGAIVRDHEAGVVLPQLDAASVAASLPAVRRVLDDPQARARCAATARRYFDVDEGTARYARLYDRLLGGRG